VCLLAFDFLARRGVDEHGARVTRDAPHDALKRASRMGAMAATAVLALAAAGLDYVGAGAYTGGSMALLSFGLARGASVLWLRREIARAPAAHTQPLLEVEVSQHT
jgi:hypothetical protein